MRPIYLLPGRGGRLNAGLGLVLKAKGYHLSGRETLGDFAKLPLHMQAQAIADDLQGEFWDGSAQVIANSYGAYLFLFCAIVDACIPRKSALAVSHNRRSYEHFDWQCRFCTSICSTPYGPCNVEGISCS